MAKIFTTNAFFSLVLDDKFDVAGKAASYPVAEVSRNYFLSKEALPNAYTTRNLINKQKNKWSYAKRNHFNCVKNL